MLTLDRRYHGWLRSPFFWAAAALFSGLAYGTALGLELSPLVLLGVPIGLVVLGVAWWQPGYGIAALLMFEWSYLTDVLVAYHGVPSPSKLLVALLAGILFLRRFVLNRQKLLYDSMQWWLLGYFFVTTLSLWYAFAPDRSYRLIEEVAKQLLLYLIIVNLLTTPRTFRTAMWMLLGIGALLGTLTVYQEITHNYANSFGGLARTEVAQLAEGYANRPRAGGPTTSPLAFGQQLIVVVPVGLWGVLYGRNLWQRMFGAYCAAACLAGIGLCFSRSTYIATAVVLGLFALHIRLKPKYLLLTVPLIAVLLAVAPPEFRIRAATLADLIPKEQVTDTQGDFSFLRRSVEMMMAINMFVDHPILGVGGDNYPALYPQYIRETGSPVPDEERTPHNYYLEVAAETGIVGLIAWGGTLLLAWHRLRQARRDFAVAGDNRMTELATALEIGFVGYLVTALFIHGAYSFLFWLQISWAVAIAAIARRTAARAQLGVPAS